MSWKAGSKEEQRAYLIDQVFNRGVARKKVCLDLGIDRRTAYKWLERYRQGGIEQLRERSRRAYHQSRQLEQLWINQLVELRSEHPSWGAKKIWAKLSRQQPPIPCTERTLGRWLQRLKLVQMRRPRRLYHTVAAVAHLMSLGSSPNKVWTVDFKGKFHTADHHRADVLTVRDLYSRFGLAVRLVSRVNDETVRQEFIKIFTQYGLPCVIRVDNGTPFAGQGPYRYSSLSLWWRRLGIKVEFTRLARPGDNASHEQFHRVYKAETLRPPAANRALQQQRSNQWLSEYNQHRPHEALGGHCPIQLYTKSRRCYRPVVKNYAYPKNWQILKVNQRGFCQWKQTRRQISRIVAGLKVAFKPIHRHLLHVYIDKILLGTLQVEGSSSMRAAQLKIGTM